MISATGLSCGYGKNQVLFDVDFVAGSKVTAIIGANGSGKSTLLKAVCSLCDIYSGTIRYNDKDITKAQTHHISKMGISYMPQTCNVFYDLSIYDNLAVASMPGRPNLDGVFELFPDLARYKGTRAANLSGGQRQMLAMAMAYSKRPQVMLYDEPTANLSPKNAKMVLDKIKQLQQVRGNCTVLVEQNVTSALEISDNVYLFAGGRVVYEGSPQRLLSDPDLAKKYLGLES